MNRLVQFYNTAEIYTSNVVSSGYTFITIDGVLNNNFITDGINQNLIFPIYRVQNCAYSIQAPRKEILGLGKGATLSRPLLDPPQIGLSFSYLQMGLINEARLGFLVNRSTTGTLISTGINYNYLIDSSGNIVTDQSGNLIYLSSSQTGTFFNSLYYPNVSPISGFWDRNYNKSNDTPQGWPLTTRDARNIYLVIKNDNLDLINTQNSNLCYNTEVGVLGFGDCYLTSYRTSCGIGQFPVSNVEYICNNINFYSSGSGNFIPSVNTTNFTQNSGAYFNIPTYNVGNLPTVLLPTNILLNIQNSSGSNPNDITIDFSDIKIQNYDISFSLNRESLYGLGYSLPLDRRVNLPVIANLSFGLVVGAQETGTIVDLIKNDIPYNINISLIYETYQPFSGIGVQYIFNHAKFDKISFSQSIEKYKVATLSFTSELNPQDNLYGFFISGQLGIQPQPFMPTVYLGIDNSGNRLLFQNSNLCTIYEGNGANNQFLY